MNKLISALTFVWVGLILGISFLEAPLKFQAPDITLALGLGIGKIVFSALNKVEFLLAIAIAISFWRGKIAIRQQPLYVVVFGILIVQTFWLLPILPQSYQYTKAGRKARITLQHLLTMSSGLEVNGEANEDRYQDPRTPNGWLQTVLEAPMIHEPGDFLDYGSANPFLLGVALAEQLDLPLQDYMHEKLFAPLGIVNYINQTDDTYQDPYFGGGMLLTSRDLLKFGQLFLNKGKWNDRQVLSEAWVAESFSIYGRLQDTRDKNEYGYLWWHDRYTVGKREIKTVEARGAGGQFIFIIPELESVVVITSGNFRNRKGNQPRTILKEYILPAMLAP